MSAAIGRSVSRARAMSILDVGVVVPRLAVAVEDLDHADAPFDQPPSGQAGLGEVPLAVRLADTDRFAADVKGVLGVRLHPIGDLERLDAGIERSSPGRRSLWSEFSSLRRSTRWRGTTLLFRMCSMTFFGSRSRMWQPW